MQLSMAQATTTLDYNFTNCGFIVCDSDKPKDSLELLQPTEDVAASPFYLYQGQYVLPLNSRSLFEESTEKDVYQSTQDDENQSDQTIIYCTPEQYAEYLQMCNKNEDQHAVDTIANGMAETNISVKDYIDNIQTVSVQEPADLEDSNESQSVAEYLSYEELLQRSNYQYAILKDGQLHFQALNIKDEQTPYLKEQIDAFQASINFEDGKDIVSSSPKTEAVELDKIKGKNLITGQTVTLKKYMNKLLQNNKCSNYINKRIVIGKTSNGRRLVGKIVRVLKGEPKDRIPVHTDQVCHNGSEVKPNEHHMDTSTTSIIDAVGNILVGLMDSQTIFQQLHNGKLRMKIFMGTAISESDISIKLTLSIYGHMENIEDKWHFVVTKIEDCIQADHVEPVSNSNDDNQQVFNKETPPKHNPNAYELEKLQRNNDTNIVYIALLIVIGMDGKTSTKIHFRPCTPTLNRGFEVQVHNTLFGCDECYELVENEILMFRHKKMFHMQRWSCTVCSVCNKKFNSVGSLKRHSAIHNASDRLLQCTICLQRFTDHSSLKKHLLIHSSIRAFVCKVCQRSFLNQADLSFHGHTHEPVKLFSCEVCGREFSRQSNLIRHSDIHRGAAALFQCHICKCSYSFASSLTRHIVHKHLGNITVHT